MKKLLVVLVIVGLVLGGVVYLWARPGESGQVDYTTTPIEFGNLTESVSATGVLQPDEVAVVIGEVPSKVTDILVKLNQEVKQGDPLLKLDSREASERLKLARFDEQLALAKLGEATAQEQAARAAYDKLSRLKDVTPEPDVIAAKAHVTAATAQVQEVEVTIQKAHEGVHARQLALDATTIKAPISGTIIDKKVYLGQPVGVAAAQNAASVGKEGASNISGPLFVIARNLASMDVHAQVLEGDIAKIRLGKTATFRPYAYSNRVQPFQATVSEIHQMPRNIQGAVLYDVVLKTKNERDPHTNEWMLRPGMTATVDIVRRQHRDAWKLPVAALDFQLDEHYQTPEARAKLEEWRQRSDRQDWQVIWTVKDGRAWPVFARTNAVDQEGEPIGISDGEYKEVVQWDPEVQGTLDSKNRDSYLRAIIAAPQWQKPGLFDQPAKFKFS